MGLGDQLMATGIAKGAHKRGKRIAFGDGQTIKWDHHSRTIFLGNPNIALPGTERRKQNLEWVHFYKGNRTYNTHDVKANRWVWNYEFKAKPGELYFARQEIEAAKRAGADYIVIEPELAWWKSSSINKDWGKANYQTLVDALIPDFRIVQLVHTSVPVLRGATAVPTTSFRDGLAILSRASLYIGPEGGLHHGAAAVDVPAVVLFGGFIPPQVTGYATHTNLTGGAEACGSLKPCEHCREAMANISVDEVVHAVNQKMRLAA